MKITLSDQFFTDMLQLAPAAQTTVLTVCQQLMAGDEDTVLTYELPADSPEVLVDFVKRLKRRIRTARRRRERLAAKALESNKNNATEASQATRTTTPKNRPTYEEAIQMLDAAIVEIIGYGACPSFNDLCIVQEKAANLLNYMDIKLDEKIRYA